MFYKTDNLILKNSSLLLLIVIQGNIIDVIINGLNG